MSKVTHWDGGMAIGIGKGESESIANTNFSLGEEDLYVEADLGVDGSSYFDGTITVGLDDTGYDVKFFGETSGAFMLWDESVDTLKLVGGAKLNAQGTVTVGVDDTGFDVKLFGATSGAYMLWDESKDQLELAGVAQLKLAVHTNGLPSSPDEGATVAYTDGGGDTKLYTYLDGAWEKITSS